MGVRKRELFSGMTSPLLQKMGVTPIVLSLFIFRLLFFDYRGIILAKSFFGNLAVLHVR